MSSPVFRVELPCIRNENMSYSLFRIFVYFGAISNKIKSKMSGRVTRLHRKRSIDSTRRTKRSIISFSHRNPELE